MKPFQHKGKNLFFHENEDIKIPTHDPKSEFYKDLEDYEKETSMKKCWIDIKKDETIEDGIKKYTEKVLKIREDKAGKEWVPNKYRKNFNRQRKLERILK